MGEESAKKQAGRPEGSVPKYSIEITTVDPVTSRMIDAIVTYGRFGRSRPEVALFIIRTWLMERENYLTGAIQNRDSPLGRIYPESEG
jgi:hypothetical protein